MRRDKAKADIYLERESKELKGEKSRLVANRWVGAQVEHRGEEYIAQGQEAMICAVIVRQAATAMARQARQARPRSGRCRGGKKAVDKGFLVGNYGMCGTVQRRKDSWASGLEEE